VIGKSIFATILQILTTGSTLPFGSGSRPNKGLAFGHLPGSGGPISLDVGPSAARARYGATARNRNGAVTSAVLVHLRVEPAHFDWRWRARPALARLAWEALARDPLVTLRRIQVESTGTTINFRPASITHRDSVRHRYRDERQSRHGRAADGSRPHRLRNLSACLPRRHLPRVGQRLFAG
jgi:hypothetical protein